MFPYRKLLKKMSFLEIFLDRYIFNRYSNNVRDYTEIETYMWDFLDKNTTL